jgi:hypothetical protein
MKRFGKAALGGGKPPFAVGGIKKPPAAEPRAVLITVSFIVKRYLSLAGLAATYSSKS